MQYGLTKHKSMKAEEILQTVYVIVQFMLFQRLIPKNSLNFQQTVETLNSTLEAANKLAGKKVSFLKQILLNLATFLRC